MTAFSLRRRYLPIAAGLLSLFVASCSSTKPKSGYSDVVDYTSPNTGLSQEEYPFDKEGNYLADVVSGKKKGKPASRSTYSKPAPVENPYIDTYEKPVITAVDTPPEKRNPIYDRVPEPDSGNASFSSGGGSSSSRTKTTGSSASSSSASKAKPKTTATASTVRKPAASKPKSKPVAVAKSKPQPKTKPKPAPLAYKVKNGDTLYGLANRYNTSVAAIKQANGMSSNTLQNGRTLRIPRK